ncbi:MAG: ComEC/Rec2 family competence protein [Deltaproteobacteria bacterium]|nr:ComEC/Rec2 family competence protein [Deltaproteobacteria bacterium]
MKQGSIKRALAITRANLPLLPVLSALIIGQVAGLFGLPSFLLALFAALTAVAFSPGEAARKMLSLAVFISGGASVLLTVNNPRPISPNGDSPYLAYVISEPRHPRPGEVTLNLQLMAWRGIRESSAPNARSFLAYCRAVDLPWRNVSHLKQGDSAIVYARVTPIVAKGPISYDSSLIRKGFSATCKIRWSSLPQSREENWLHILRHVIAQRVQAVLGKGERAGLFLSMGLGFRDHLSSRTEESFRRTGLSHLLVLSGYQVTLLFVMLYSGLFSLFKLFPRFSRHFNCRTFSSITALIFSAFFVLITSPETSSIRAVIAASLVTISRELERGGGFFHGMTFSLLVICIIWPASFLDPGLQLTYAALLGIGLGGFLEGRTTLRSYLLASGYISIFTSIAVLIWFDGISLLGFIVNPLLAPILSFLSCNVGFVALALALTGEQLLSTLLMNFIGDGLELMRDGIVAMSQMPLAYLKPQGISWAVVFTILSAAGAAIITKQVRRHLQNAAYRSTRL